MVKISTYLSPIRKIFIAESDGKIVKIFFEGQKKVQLSGEVASQFEEVSFQTDSDVIKLTKRWLDKYFNRENPSINEIPFTFCGSDFQNVVWKCLLEVEYGKTTTYGELAKKVCSILNKPKMSAQAIGGAVSLNPLAILIPCHRVVGRHGKLTGYAAGIDKKIELLRLEKSVTVKKL